MAAQNTETETGAKTSLSSKIKLFGLLAAVTVWALITGYYRMFSVFSGWDDEGYLMMTVKQFLAGDILYKEIWTLYGPAFYIYKWTIHGLFDLPITHDVTKFTTLLMWVSIGLLGGLFVYRLTRSKFGAAAAYALVFLTLYVSADVPGHPQELCGVLMVAGLLIIPGDCLKRGSNLRLILLGACVAGVILTKINIGVFYGLALAVTFTACAAQSRLQRLAFVGLTLAAAALPFVLLRRQLSMHWFELGVLVAAALLGVALVNLSQNGGVFSVRHCALVLLSFFITAISMFAVTMPADTSPAIVFDGLISIPSKFSNLVSNEGIFYRRIIGWAAGGAATAAAVIFYAKSKPRQTEIVVWFLQAMFGLATVSAILIGYYSIAVKAIEKAGGFPSTTSWFFMGASIGQFIVLNFATPFLWLVIAKQIGKQNFSADYVPRAALVIVAILQTLQIYPVPGGSHQAIAAFPMVIAGVVCLCDAFSGFKTRFPRPFGQPRFYTAAVAAAILILIIAGGYRTYRIREFHNSQVALNLPGATRTRVSEAEVARYNFIIQNLKLNCDSFVSMPSFMSFNLWAQKETPTATNITGWMRFTTDSQQREVIEKLKTARRGCAVYSAEWTQFWGVDKQNLRDYPLSAYILDHYTTAATVNGYEFMRQNGTVETLVYAAEIVSDERNTIEFTLPPAFNFDVYRIELFDISIRRTIADTRKIPVALSDERNAAVEFPLASSADSSAARKYRLQWSDVNPAQSADTKNLILRLYDRDDRIIAYLPFPVN